MLPLELVVELALELLLVLPDELLDPVPPWPTVKENGSFDGTPTEETKATT